MTDNSAEREAEEILKAAAEDIQAEECPLGRECGVHFRVDEEVTDQADQYARYITYLGDHVVITEDNHELSSPLFLFRALTGQISKDELPDKWETSIYLVGEGTIGDLANAPVEVRKDSMRYSKTHNDWSEVRGVHNVTVEALRSGLVDVSQPKEL